MSHTQLDDHGVDEEGGAYATVALSSSTLSDDTQAYFPHAFKVRLWYVSPGVSCLPAISPYAIKRSDVSNDHSLLHWQLSCTYRVADGTLSVDYTGRMESWVCQRGRRARMQ